jgi:hypothetical protein
VVLASRADRVVYIQDGHIRTERAVRSSQTVDIGFDGQVTLPSDMVSEAAMGRRATAQVVDEGILLNREVHP